MGIYFIFAAIILLFVIVLLLPLRSAADISSASKKKFIAAIAVVFSASGLFFYSLFGSPEILPLIAEKNARVAELKEDIVANSEVIKKDPQNLKAWVELGDDFMQVARFSSAANAYKQAILISQGNPVLIGAYARALIAAADGSVSEEAKKSLDMAIMLTPENEEVRYYLALYKMQNGNMPEAMEEMKSLYKTLSSDSPVKKMIDRQIGRGEK